MIVGNGLVAKTVKSCDREGIIIFASGVSNSVNPQPEDFEREINLLSQYVAHHKKLIYFSTISVFDNSVNENAYIKHKLAMEQYIADNCSSYLILRLPNVIGNQGNPNTLFPFFKKALKNNFQVNIKESAFRYLLTTAQLNKMLFQLLESEVENQLINCVLEEPYLVKDIYLAMASALKATPKFTLSKGGVSYKVLANFEFSIEKPESLASLIEEQVLQSQN